MVTRYGPSFASALLLLSQIANPSFALKFTPTGQTVQLDGTSYYIPPDVVSTIKVPKHLKKALDAAGGVLPLTIVNAKSFEYSEKDFSHDVASYTSVDDVFNKGFLEGNTKIELLGRLQNLTVDSCVRAISWFIKP